MENLGHRHCLTKCTLEHILLNQNCWSTYNLSQQRLPHTLMVPVFCIHILWEFFLATLYIISLRKVCLVVCQWKFCSSIYLVNYTEPHSALWKFFRLDVHYLCWESWLYKILDVPTNNHTTLSLQNLSRFVHRFVIIMPLCSECFHTFNELCKKISVYLGLSSNFNLIICPNLGPKQERSKYKQF